MWKGLFVWDPFCSKEWGRPVIIFSASINQLIFRVSISQLSVSQHTLAANFGPGQTSLLLGGKAVDSHD